MSKSKQTIVQNYPRIEDPDSQYAGCLDDSQLVQHTAKLPIDQLKDLITSAISAANSKSSRIILSIPPDATEAQIEGIYKKQGRALLKYCKKYCTDPAATAHQMHQKHFRQVGIDLFRRRSLHKERMNSGWRYQYLTIYCARETGRFQSVSDIGTAEADFNATIAFRNDSRNPLNLYVSVKNRANTVGGQDFPKVAQALEMVAQNDKNRIGPYLCVFGIAMDRGTRQIRRQKGTGIPHALNTEIWLSDYFWPFFTNYSYEEIMTLVLEVLESWNETNEFATQADVPDALLASFRDACNEIGLLDENGYFDDARKLVRFFCSP
jgi:hypothetical protein